MIEMATAVIQPYFQRCRTNLSDPIIKNNSKFTVNTDLEKELSSSVKLSDHPDMITRDDSPYNKRAETPCGHAIGPDSLTEYCRNLLIDGKYVFRCPYIDKKTNQQCGQTWDYITVRRLAALREEEKSEFETKLSKNYMRNATGIQECPKCTSFCIRQNKKDKRVVCLVCSKGGDRYEFCWNCLGTWKTSGIDKCGNEACSGEEPRLKILREAPKIAIIGLTNCPSIRACPKCGALISHTKGCKHMVCICGQMFCFICLKRAVNGKYQCGSFNSHCTIAAVQTKMPRDENQKIEGSQCAIL